MKEKLLDKPTIDAYHSYVQSQIRSDLNSISLGPGRLPCRAAIGLVLFGLCCLLVGILLVTLRYLHVYFWDWNDQFVGPFFVILFLMCCSGATYLILVAVRRSNRFRRELYFHPLGDYGIAAVPKEDLVHEQELKHDLKSGTTPHKSVLPRSEAYSQMNLAKDRRGHHNQGYRPGPGDPYNRPPYDRRRGPPPDDRRRGPPPDGRRGPPPDDRRRPPDDRRRPPDDRRGPPDGRRGPPPGEYRRGPPPHEGRRGPPPDGYRGPPPEGRRGPDDRRGPPPDDRRGPPPDDRRGPPPDDRRGPPPGYNGHAERRGPPPDDRGPRGVPHFRERTPDDDMGRVKLDIDKESESVL